MKTVSAFLLAAAMTSSAPAALVSLIDPSFESQVSGTLFPTTYPGADGGWWRDTFLSPGGNGGMLYVNDATSGNGSRAALLGYPPELRLLQQTVTTTYAANTDYTLTVYARAVAYSPFELNETATLTLTLFDGVTTAVIKEQDFTVSKNDVLAARDRSFTVTAAEIAAAGAVGRRIGIRLEKSALGPALDPSFTDGRIELRVDNVRLDAIPEPGTAGLLALAGFLGLRRRRRA